MELDICHRKRIQKLSSIRGCLNSFAFAWDCNLSLIHPTSLPASSVSACRIARKIWRTTVKSRKILLKYSFCPFHFDSGHM